MSQGFLTEVFRFLLSLGLSHTVLYYPLADSNRNQYLHVVRDISSRARTVT